MITIETLVLIVNLCLNSINPTFDPDICSSFIVECLVVDKRDMDTCLEYYEPIAGDMYEL